MMWLEYILLGVLYLFGFYLIFNCAYLLFFSISGHFLKKQRLLSPAVFKRICVLFPAYRENDVILHSSIRAIQHTYNGEFSVVVIADGLQDYAIEEMRENGIKVIPVAFDKSTKGKSLLFALNKLDVNSYDIAVILDIDNIMNNGFLNDINAAYMMGARVIQGHRTAKNLDTPFAFLDSCNEEINNHIYRKGHYALGLSPALIGSGMAFEFRLLRDLLSNIGDTVGEDKEMDFQIAKSGQRIVYLEESLVFDEKIDNAAVFTQQRTRWIAAQIEFVRKYFFIGFRELFVNGNFEFFNKVLQAILVPRMLLLGLLFCLTFFSLLFLSSQLIFFFGSLLVVLCCSLLLALPIRYYRDKRLTAALFRIPLALWSMVLALFRIGRAKKSFMATPHRTEGVTDDLTKLK